MNNVERERIVVTGLGPVHALGIGKSAFFSALSKGINGAKETRSIDVQNYKYQYSCEVENIDPLLYGVSELPAGIGKASLYAIVGSQLAIEDAGLSLADLENKSVGCFLGTTDGESQLIDGIVKGIQGRSAVPAGTFDNALHSRISRNVSSYLKSRGPAYTIGNACSASNASIISAVEYLQDSDAEFAICGGSDVVCRKTFSIFHRLSAISEKLCTPFDVQRKGIIPAEGASILLLEKLSSARARGAHIYGEIVGYGMSCDATHMTNLNPDKIRDCLNTCLESAGLSTFDVDYISMHGTGTMANDFNEYQALQKVFTDNIPICGSIKSMIGHAMGAAAGFGAIACMFSFHHGIPPTINVSEQDPEINITITDKLLPKDVKIAINNAFAFGGNNSIIAFKKVNDNE
ncbi:beta-ketoacyl-[acyl-carrier-protein] synthase family protein [Xenorhabdus bovienii]|uniref:beta-ketoacyl-[acyl-carrier-protein] synthase family protein n=1 Tax=Xenorhabdus bovienii TaxID=40576 RepID=UPI0023B222D5|nr:beta-ketoacyl-[acyl-carrier-protein] synthase family protein [Xenorhabdus bovienii]MDE9446073.1 beta-ketoacyl-[acyl-carrier-protein] synthase family protein [Xenorhabdus bovienii]